MLHLRLIVPPDLRDQVADCLSRSPAVTNVVRVAESAVDPPGDMVLCDVARESASEIIQELRDLGVPKEGSIAVLELDVSLSAAAERAERAAPGLPTDAVVWEEVEARTAEESSLSATYLAFMCVAMMIAGIGLLLDQPILIVGAMVVGPEFGPVAGVCVGLVQRRHEETRRSLLALLVGFPVGMVATVLLIWALTAAGLLHRSMLLADRPLTQFIYQPDALSFVVAFLAGVAGLLSLTSAKSGALVGVLISVTTVPAAANVAVALGYGVWEEAGGSALQLLINITGILCAGTATLLVQQRAWRRTPASPASTASRA